MRLSRYRRPRGPSAFRARGFNLVELLIVLTIGALLVLWALPDFRDAIQSNRVRARASDLQFAFEQARNMALARGVPVTVSPTDSGFSREDLELTFDMDIVVFIDFDADGTLDDVDEVVQRTGRAEPGVTASAGKPAGLIFNALGEASTNGFAQRTYRVCSRTGKYPEIRDVGVAPSGRVTNKVAGKASC